MLTRITDNLKSDKEPNVNCDICKGSGVIKVEGLLRKNFPSEEDVWLRDWHEVPCYECCMGD